jgi:hypothetical protein
MIDLWRGAGLTDSEAKLLFDGMAPTLREVEKYCDPKYNYENIAMASANFGRLGKGVIVLLYRSCSCGATGNCPILVYVREKDRYRAILGDGRAHQPYGWAYGVVNSKTDVPDLVFGSHSSSNLVRLELYRYSNGQFALHGCEFLRSKSESTINWWNPAEVIVEPCVKQQPPQ